MGDTEETTGKKNGDNTSEVTITKTIVSDNAGNEFQSANATLSEKQKEIVREIFKADFAKSVQDFKQDIKDEGQEIKRDFLTIFGLFASFVTFLSIEVQIFKTKENILELLGISCLSLSFVLFFALVINDIAKDKSSWKDFGKPTYIMNLILVVVGVVCLFKAERSVRSELKDLYVRLGHDSTVIVRQQVRIDTLSAQIKRLQK